MWFTTERCVCITGFPEFSLQIVAAIISGGIINLMLLRHYMFSLRVPKSKKSVYYRDLKSPACTACSGRCVIPHWMESQVCIAILSLVVAIQQVTNWEKSLHSSFRGRLVGWRYHLSQISAPHLRCFCCHRNGDFHILNLVSCDALQPARWATPVRFPRDIIIFILRNCI